MHVLCRHRLLPLALAVALLSGCASRTPWKHSVPIDERPSPAAADTAKVRAPEPDARALALARAVADTTEAGRRARRCRTQKLLPDQETVLDATIDMLGRARAALRASDVVRGESYARQARQLAASLRCT